MKSAIVVLSDPGSGSEEALGRVYNALAAAYDFEQRGDEVTLLFQGAGTRWPAQLSKADHPAHELFKQVEGLVAGVSSGCADVFDARDDAQAAGFDLINDNPVPGTSGLPSMRRLLSEGYAVLTF